MAMQNIRLLVTAAVVLVFGLAGCDSMPRQVSYATWKQPLPRVEPQATVTPVRLDVHFAPDEGALNPDDQSAIDGFLAHNQITTGNSVALVVAPPGPGEGKLTASRVSAVQQNLESRGIMVQSVLAVQSAEPGTVSVLGQATKVQLPACAGYNAPIPLDNEYQPVMLPGCYSTMDLDLMVANPADLVQGRQLPPADAEYSAQFVAKYRAGAATAASAPSTTSVSSGSGSGQ
ncbi:MAG: CpaD family pilus assembly lipoprotein [Isosphaerales bacterium]